MMRILLCLFLIYQVNATKEWSKWPNATVFYSFGPNLNQDNISQFDLAIEYFEDNTCVHFESSKSNDTLDVQIELDNSELCYSFENVINEPGNIKFSNSCFTREYIIYGLMHHFSFVHRNRLKSDYADRQDDLWDAFSYYYKKDNSMSVLDYDKMNELYDCRSCLGYRWRNRVKQSSNVFVSGIDINGEEMVPCRAYNDDEIIPGKGDLKYRQCSIAFNGSEIIIEDKVEFLTNPYGANLAWIKRTNESVPDNAIKAGFRNGGENILYIGRCLEELNEDNKTKPLGWIDLIENANIMYFGSNGTEVECEDYEVLVCDE